MNKPRSSVWHSAVLAVLLPVSVNAQYYGPRTDYHDPVQRVFPVEAARVLAWFGGQTNIAEVSFTVTNRNEQTAWELQWLDQQRKPLKTATIAYPNARLKAGTEFYRDVFRQIWALDWGPAPTLNPEEAPRRFWQGASRVKLSREASLLELGQLAAGTATKASKERAPELAGLLIHSALPSLADRVSLDGVLVARGATWLALAEEAGGRKFDVLWAPALLLAGREFAALAVWTNGPAGTGGLTGATAPQRGWDILLRKPTSRNIFAFAAEPGHLPMAMPMLGRDGWINRTTPFLGDILPELVPGQRDVVELHNYAPMFARRSSIGGGHLLQGAWAVFSRQAWLELLAAQEPAAGEDPEYDPLLKSTRQSHRRAITKLDESQDASLAGFKECAPLLRLAHKLGAGPLRPTGTVALRDLLNYGWEMAGMQLGGRYQFVQTRWGVREQAQPILQAATTELPSWLPFFLSERYARNRDYVNFLQRLQMLDGFFHRVGFSAHPFMKGNPQDAAAVQTWIRRCWLRPLDFEWQARSLWDTAPGDISPLIEALQEQQGALASAMILGYLTEFDDASAARIPDYTNRVARLADRLPQPSLLYFNAVYAQRFAPMNDLDRAQALERLYWQAPESRLEPQVFMNYIYAGAYDSAVRFYRQFRGNFTDPVFFSNRLGMPAWVLGYLTGSKDVRRMALEDSNSGSGSDMTLHLWETTANGDLKGFEKQVQERIERYDAKNGTNSLGVRLAGFIPYLPALRDPRHPQRAAALDYFGPRETASVLRWIWTREYKMPADDAIRFLGGPNSTNLFLRTVVSHLQGNAKLTAQAVDKLEAEGPWRDEHVAVARFLMFSMQADRKPIPDQDLKPANASSLAEFVQATLKSARQRSAP